MDLRELYQEVIMDHNRNPHNRGRLDPCTHHAEGYNPLCGDMIVVELNEVDGTIAEIRFDGQGCAISTASASMMTDVVKGKSTEEAALIFVEVQKLLTEPGETPESLREYEELQALAGVRDFPVRIKCAILPWHALKAAIDKQTVPAKTE